MKTIGLIGGMSWESTVTYYQEINRSVAARLGGLHSARLCLFSVDFAEIEKMQHAGDWDAAGEVLIDAARRLEAAGAAFLVICTNTMHLLAPRINAAVRIPLLHIADATGESLVADGITKAGLLGTRFTMEQSFYTSRLREYFGIEVIVPSEPQRDTVHRVIYEELCLGESVPASRESFLRIIGELAERGAQAVILGCTEIGLLVGQRDTDVPLYDTANIHCRKSVDFALRD